VVVLQSNKGWKDFQFLTWNENLMGFIYVAKLNCTGFTGVGISNLMPVMAGNVKQAPGDAGSIITVQGGIRLWQNEMTQQKSTV